MSEPKMKTNPPPETKILSETRRELPEGSQTSPNPGFAGPSESAVETAPGPVAPEQLQTETEPVESAFTIDEEGKEIQEEEESKDRVQAAQAEMHKTKQELSQLKKVLAAMAANVQIGSQAPSGAPPIPPELSNPEPTEEERIDPTLYTRRMIRLSEVKREQESAGLEMQSFVENHSDYEDVLPAMTQIRNEEPWIAQGPGSLSRLYKRAKEREELEGYRAAMKDSTDKAFQAGGNMQKQKGTKSFVSPAGGGGIKSKVTMPPDFSQWSTDKQQEWLIQHGFVRDDQF